MSTFMPQARLQLLDTTETGADVSNTRDTFVRLTRAELDRAYRMAGLILGNTGDAEDAVGDAIERAWTHVGELREPDRFQAWFDRILVNACRDRIRRRGRVRFVQLAPEFDTPAAGDAFERAIERDQILRAMVDLTPDEREVVVLHFYADLTLEAVAERLGWRTGTVKSRLHRALGKMRRQLDSGGHA
jgi:RNA polymerase sigma-70 factor (ECF subfamily)